MSSRIGPPSIWELVRGPLQVAIILDVTFALTSILAVALKSWGHHRSFNEQVRLWCVVFGTLVALTLVQGMFGRRDRAIAIGLLGGLVLAAVWWWGVPVYGILSGTYGVVVPPVS